MRAIIGPIFILLFFIACTPSTNTQTAAAPQLSTSSCNIGKWPNISGGVLNLKMSNEFNGDFAGGDFVNGLNPLEQVAKNWNSAISGTTFFKVPFDLTTTSGYSDVSSFRDSELGIYKSHTWFSNVSSQALAITQFYGYVRTDTNLGNYIELTHADIIVNYRDFGAKLTNGLPTAYGRYDLPTIVLHEMGHFLGLCHETAHTSVMQPYYNSTQRTLKAYDVTKITDLYVNNTITPMMARTQSNAISMPEGTLVKGIIELNANGKCKHYINGKLTYEH